MRKTTSTLAVLGIVLSVAPALHADEPTTIQLPQDEEIQLALEAGPEHLRADATVYLFGKDGYRKTRSGPNGFTCLVNRDGQTPIHETRR